MTAIQDRSRYFGAASSADRLPTRIAGPSALALAAVLALSSVVIGVVAAYVIFPEPTMWRIVVNLLVLGLAVPPIRALVRGSSDRASGSAARETDSER